MEIIKQVKALLGISDNLQDNLLNVIQELTEAHFKAYTGKKDIPDELNFIIVEVVIKRFNRVGSEGLKSQKVEGLTLEFSLDDFGRYDKAIQKHYPSEYRAGFKML